MTIMTKHGGKRPNAGGKRVGAGRPRLDEPRIVSYSGALTEREASLIKKCAMPGEAFAVTVRRMALEYAEEYARVRQILTTGYSRAKLQQAMRQRDPRAKE